MEEMNNTTTAIDLAEAQFMGFIYGKDNNILGLVESMGLTKQEWILLKDNVYLSENDKYFIDKYFNL